MHSRILALCTLTLLCVRAHADSAPVWLEVTSPHFIVVTDASEKQARHIAGQFERMQGVFHKILPGAHSDSGAPIVVLALKNKRDFQTVEPAEYLTKGKLDLAGLFLQSNDRTYILVRLDAGGDHPYSTVYHEYTHYITRHADLPLWLNEGIAEFYQNSDIDSHEIRFGQPSTGDIQLLRSQSLLPLPTLFTVDHDSPYYHDEEKGTMFYSESWALTYMLYINDFRNKTNLIGNYLKALSAGQTSLPAAITAFGDLKKLESALDTQISHGDFAYLTLPINLPIDEASYGLKPLAPPDADAYRAAVLLSDGRTDDARKLLDSVLAANPSNALAHETQGILHLRENDLEAARQSYTQAVALHSTSFLAWYYAATLTLRNGNHDDPSIEPNLEQSIKLNPNFAPANDALASYYAMHRNLDDALRLNLLAVTLEPDNLNYRLNNASIHMQRKELPSALSVLEAARPFAHSPAEIAELNARVYEVHRYEEQLAAAASAPATVTTVASTSTAGKPVTMVVADDDPHYPDTPPAGPHHTARGVLHNVQCAYPTILTLTVEGGAKPVSLYTNHMYKIEYSAGNFYPKGGLDPCKIEGMKAVVTYTAVTDPRVAGQIVSVEVNK
jgi:tetratricopeptide (TPR) repeat protein